MLTLLELLDHGMPEAMSPLDFLITGTSNFPLSLNYEARFGGLGFFLRFYLFIVKERGREKEREGEKH